MLFFLDDICVCTQTFEKHLEVLEIIISRIREADLTLNRDKCQFCKPELKCLDNVVGKAGLMVDPEKVESIVRIPTPKLLKFVGWLGLHLGIVGLCKNF